jgi:hypothetical protein
MQLAVALEKILGDYNEHSEVRNRSEFHIERVNVVL